MLKPVLLLRHSACEKWRTHSSLVTTHLPFLLQRNMSARQNAKRSRDSDAVTADAIDADTVTAPPLKLTRSSSVGSGGWPSPAFQPEPAPAVIDLSASDSNEPEAASVPVLLSPAVPVDEEAERRAFSLLCWTEDTDSKIRNLRCRSQFNPYNVRQASDTLREGMQRLSKVFWKKAKILPKMSVHDVTSYSKMTPAQISDLPRWEQTFAEAFVLFDNRFQALALTLLDLDTKANAYLARKYASLSRNVTCA